MSTKRVELKAKANSELLQACKDAKIRQFSRAMAAGADVNFRDKTKYNRTPIMVAIIGDTQRDKTAEYLSNQLSIIKSLIKLGANVNAREHGWVKRIVDGVNCPICLDRTVLHIAAGGSSTKIVKLLLDNGANPNAKAVTECIWRGMVLEGKIKPFHVASMMRLEPILPDMVELLRVKKTNILSKYPKYLRAAPTQKQKVDELPALGQNSKSKTDPINVPDSKWVN